MYQRLKINVILHSLALMSGDNMDRRTEIPMCHRNSVICRYGNRGSHTRNYFIRNALLCEKLQFLSSSSKKERIAAFQTYYPVALFCLISKNLVNLLLGHSMVAGTFSHIDQFCRSRNSGQDSLSYQAVINNHICLFQNLGTFHCKKPHISRTSSHQPDFSRFFFVVFLQARLFVFHFAALLQFFCKRSSQFFCI